MAAPKGVFALRGRMVGGGRPVAHKRELERRGRSGAGERALLHYLWSGGSSAAVVASDCAAHSGVERREQSKTNNG